MQPSTRREQLEALLTEEPNDSFLRYGLAMEYVSQGDDAGAVLRFAELFAATPDYMPGYMQGGQALGRLGRVEEARETFRRGIAMAQQQGNHHAAEEMQEMLENLA